MAAVTFLTRIPVGSWHPRRRAKTPTAASPDGAWGTTGAAAFGAVGALIGAAGSIPLLLLGERAPLAAGVLAVAVMALLSGALHLDGLADTVDALAAPTAEAADRARKDPRAGPAGAAAIALVIAADAALLAAAVELRGPAAGALACVVAGAGSRAVAPLAGWWHRRSRGSRAEQRGLGAWFVARAGFPAAAASWLTALVLSVLVGSFAGAAALPLGLVLGTCLTIALSISLTVVRGGLDGDGLGFLVELGFSAILLVTVLTL